MKLTSLFKRKNTPWVVYIVCFISIVLSVLVFIKPELFDTLAMWTKPEHFWQYISGIFVHGAKPRWFLWVHLGMNMLGLIPFGIIVEKALGSKKSLYLFAAEWAVTAVLFQIIHYGSHSSAAGISSIEYAYATAAIPFVWHVFRVEGKRIFKQPLTYYFIFEYFGMLSLLNPMMGMASLLLHTSGIVVGIMFLLFNKKSIAAWKSSASLAE